MSKHWMSPHLKRIVPGAHDENNPEGVRVPVGAIQQSHNILLYKLVLHP